MVTEHQSEHASQWAAIGSIAAKIGCTGETLRGWVQQAERDQGMRGGPTTEDRGRIKTLERKNRELRHANEILRKASAYFAQAELAGSGHLGFAIRGYDGPNAAQTRAYPLQFDGDYVGFRRPLSKWETASGEQPAFSASWSCVASGPVSRARQQPLSANLEEERIATPGSV